MAQLPGGTLPQSVPSSAVFLSCIRFSLRSLTPLFYSARNFILTSQVDDPDCEEAYQAVPHSVYGATLNGFTPNTVQATVRSESGPRRCPSSHHPRPTDRPPPSTPAEATLTATIASPSRPGPRWRWTASLLLSNRRLQLTLSLSVLPSFDPTSTLPILTDPDIEDQIVIVD